MSSFYPSFHRIRFLFLSLGSIGILAGCTTVIPERNPELSVRVPAQWDRPESGKSVPVAEGPVPHAWVATLGDDHLESLVNEAMRNNLDLRLAVARMESARHLSRIARAGLYPSAGLSAEGSFTETNGATFDAFGEDQYRWSVNASWEADVWGKVRAEAASGRAEWEASSFDYQQARHSIAAAVCGAWYDLIAARQQLELAEATLKSYNDTARLIQNRYEAGIDSALDYRLALANAESARGGLEQRKEQYKRAQRILQTLLGRYPDGTLVANADFPQFDHRLYAGIPSDLVNRRPDIRAAERRLASAEASVRAKSRQRLPSIQLTGSTGNQTAEFENLLDANFDFWTLATSVSQPIYTGGRLDADEKRAEALFEQARVAYEQAVLSAFYEVEQGLDADLFFANLESASRAASEQSREAERLAWDRYTAGLINIVTVLEAQRRSLIASQNLINARNSRVKNRIQLYLALGGGFSQ